MMPFTDQDIYEATKNALEGKISEYISSHGGKIELLGVKDAVIFVRLAGSCSGCSMSLLTTKMVIERELKMLIHPEISVVNVEEPSSLPADLYTGPKHDSLFDKIKKTLS